MATPNPLQLPHAARQALLTGPTITLALPLPSINTTYTIPALPRRMLFAFSHLAAAQLTVADGVNTTPMPTPSSSSASSPSPIPTPARTITLPPSSCTPAALELLLQHLKQCCRSPASAPPPPHLTSWRQAVHVYAAARALRLIPAVESPLRGWIEKRLNASDAPLSAAELRDAVEALSGGQHGGDEGGDRIVREVVRKTAAWARRLDVGGLEVEREGMKTWLAENRPRLLAWWEVCDSRASGSDLRAKSGMEGKKKEEEEESRREELQRKVDGFRERLKKQRSMVELAR
ncbi:hypothetical protein SLS58_004745 [Diplodia intermedia]|uniref:Uncharacterized protein n=1 Tax=Diplodia intermedia TaxID=856260 RepID=A0ABR3TST7_9PEZI